jgi:hypothetical protein
MKVKILAIIILFFYCVKMECQTRKIVGIVYEINDANTKKPVPPGAQVFIPGIGSATTDSKGYYSIDISQCASCTTGTTLMIYANSIVGYGEKEYIIPINPALKPFDIGIKENSKLALTGVIKDKKTGKSVKGVKVSVLIQNTTKIAPVKTDEEGFFYLMIRKDGISNMQAIQLIITDEQGRYKDIEKAVFINQYEPIKIELEPCTNCGSIYRYKIDSNIKLNIKIEAGDEIMIKATGSIKVGPLVGNSGPEGIRNGVLGFSLSDYNYFPEWNHAALLYRFGEKDEWKCYSNNSENKYIAQAAGYLEFAVNDSYQDDNSGAYEVELIIRK